MTNQVTHGLKITEIKKSFLTCGECSGFGVEVLTAGDELPCGQRDKFSESSACAKFRATAFDLQEEVTKGTTLLSVAEIMENLDDVGLRVLAGAMLNETNTRKYGGKFMMPVVVRYRGTANADYASNFMSARILDITEGKIRVMSEDGTSRLSFDTDSLAGPSVYSVEEFAPIQAKITKGERYVDPKIDQEHTSLALRSSAGSLHAAKASLDGLIVSIDDVVQKNAGPRKERNKIRSAQKKKRGVIKRGDVLTLCDAVTEVEKGYIRTFTDEETGDHSITQEGYQAKRRVRREGKVIVELSEF